MIHALLNFWWSLYQIDIERSFTVMHTGKKSGGGGNWKQEHRKTCALKYGWLTMEKKRITCIMMKFIYTTVLCQAARITEQDSCLTRLITNEAPNIENPQGTHSAKLIVPRITVQVLGVV